MYRLKPLIGACVFLGVVSVIWGWVIVQNGASISRNVLEGHRDRAPFVFSQADVVEEPINKEFSILVPQIGVNAPVYKNVDGENPTEYLPNVLKGVAHYQHKKLGEVTVDGALPGRGHGNIFLFGHSQIPGGNMDNYQGVFNNLEDLVVGDLIKVYYLGEEYLYQVNEGKVIDKTAVEYTTYTDEETLTLMSCWPLGLDLKRYMVRATRVVE